MTVINLKIKDAVVRKEKKEVNSTTLYSDPDIREFIEDKEKKAQQRGYAEGFKAGYQKRSEEVAFLVSSVEALIEKFKNAKTEFVTQIEPELVEIISMATEKILGDALVSGSASIGKIIAPVLDKIPSLIKMKVRINPEDLKQVDSFKKVLEEKAHSHEVEILGDPRIGKWGCLIETNVGTIDARFETRVKRVLDSIKEEK